MPSRCSRLNQDYQELLALQEQFSVELEQATATGDFTLLALLKTEILEKKQVFESQLNPFETALKIGEQYETQKAIYEKIGLLEKREGILGMEGIDGKWYTFPSLKEVNRHFYEQREMLDIKTDQGFIKLLIVPFGMSLEKFIVTMEKTIHSRNVEMEDPKNPGKMIQDTKNIRLFATKKKATDPDERLYLIHGAVQWPKDSYLTADTDGTLVYFPVVFDTDPKIHQGKTKAELLKNTGQGFQLLLIEANPNIPSEGTDEIIGTKQPRKRLAAGDAAEVYLKILQTKPEYSHEEGLTLEAWMTQFLLHLEETDQVIDDQYGNGKVNLNLGGWFPDSGKVADGSWNRYFAEAFMDWDVPKDGSSHNGSRTAVRI